MSKYTPFQKQYIADMMGVPSHVLDSANDSTLDRIVSDFHISIPSSVGNSDKTHNSDWNGLEPDSGNKVNNPLPPRGDGDNSGIVSRPDPNPDGPSVNRPPAEIGDDGSIVLPDPDNGRDDHYHDDIADDGKNNNSNTGVDQSWISKVFGNNMSGLIQSLIGKYTDATVTGGEIIRNQWDLDKMNIANTFSARQADIARDWQEQMYDKYNSLSGKISQAEQAGVNPLFAVTGNAVSPISSSSPSPAGSTVTGSGRGSSGDLFAQVLGFLGLKKQKAEISAIETQNAATRQQMDIDLKKLPSELASLDSAASLNLARVTEVATSVEAMKHQMDLTDRQAEVASAQMQYLISQSNYINAIQEPEQRAKRAQALILEWQEKNKELFKGLDVGADFLSSFADIGVSIFNAKTGRLLATK